MDAGTPTVKMREPASARDGRPVVEAEGLARRYEIGDVTITALEDVSLRIAEREFIVVLGPSGSGKTTLLNLLTVRRLARMDVPATLRVVE